MADVRTKPLFFNQMEHQWFQYSIDYLTANTTPSG
jgi:hypothetical protein